MPEQPFDPDSVERFRFLGCDFEAATGTVRLDYGFDDSHSFREELVFRGARAPQDPQRRAALERCLRYLHLAAGVSYFKAAAPRRISVESMPVSPATARFFDTLYREGLAEFAYRNRLELEPRFPVTAEGEPGASAVELPRRTAVPLGGGKDSVVTLEALRRAGEPMVLFSVGDFEPIRRTAEVAGVPRLVVERRVCPRLLELNRRGAYNGHVPVSAIIAFILATAAVLYGFDAAALSNERSADVPDRLWRGRPVNHEFSKGLAFERRVDELLGSRLLAGFRYFSLLRPLSELSIAGLFCRERRYFEVFRSCNAAYRLSGRARSWCGDCPKCRFVFLALAPFCGRRELTGVFGRDLLAEEGQIGGYRRLAGLEGERPLECVGEADESAAALVLLAATREWASAAVVARLARQLSARVADPRALVARVLTPAPRHRVPARLAAVRSALESAALADRERLMALLAVAGGAPRPAAAS